MVNSGGTIYEIVLPFFAYIILYLYLCQELKPIDMNLLISLYESNKITEEEIAEFISWHSEIATCCVCGTKLMHDDEAYDDMNGLGALCDAHSAYDEESGNYFMVKD